MSPTAFVGGLQQKKKSELQELAIALKLSDLGTRESLYTRIKEYLDDNQDKLEDNPKFAGLYGRRRKSAQPHHEKPPSRFANSVEDSDAKPTSTKSRDDKKAAPLEIIDEATATLEMRAVSAYLKKPPLSPPDVSSSKSVTPPRSEPQQSPARSSQSPQKQPRKPNQQLKLSPRQIPVSTLVLKQESLLRNGTELLFAIRALLSNSRNIWSLTAMIDLLCILYGVLPPKVITVPLTSNVYPVHVYYPPLLLLFKARVFWLVLLHWFIPTLLIPAIIGNLISFTPGENTSPTAAQAIPFDPLTASIVRLAAEIAYPFTSMETRAGILGLDVLGLQWRVLNAAIGVAFAFAEAIATAPKAFVAPQRGCLADSKTQVSTLGGRRGATIDDASTKSDK